MTERTWVFDTDQDRAGKCRWRLKAANGLIVADSAESYDSLCNVRRAAENVKANARSAEVN
jgi:uncharacterized protein YegP (UPF0339 family)